MLLLIQKKSHIINSSETKSLCFLREESVKRLNSELWEKIPTVCHESEYYIMDWDIKSLFSAEKEIYFPK